MNRWTAIYARVSSKSQKLAAQTPDLQAWEKAHADVKTHWYVDHFSGRTLRRPGMEDLLGDIQAGRVERLVLWRLDRLGRNARGMLEFFEECRRCNVKLESLRDGIGDLDSPGGRMMLVILASFAEYETEVRGERQRAGIAANREKQVEVQALAAQGKTAELISITLGIPLVKVRKMIAAGERLYWTVGRRPRKSKIDVSQIRPLIAANLSYERIGLALGCSRQTVLNCLKRAARENPDAET